MADLTTQDASGGIGDVTFTAASSGGDTAEAGVNVGGWNLCGMLLVDNADTVTHDVTVEGLDPVTVAVGGLAAIPLYGGGIANQRLDVTYDAVTSVTVAVVHF